jgi:peptide/nickel transport system substrate-binding protein
MYQADWEAPRFDPAEARRLLREADYRGEPIPYRLLNNYYTAQVATAQILVEGWRAVG